MVNGDLFDSHPEMTVLLENLSAVPAAELQRVWPETLHDLLAVILRALQAHGLADDEAHKLASNIAFSLGGYLGGRTIYLPNADKLKTAIRDTLIYSEFNGHNIRLLIDRYKLSEKQLYKIMENQRRLFVAKNQRNLPL